MKEENIELIDLPEDDLDRVINFPVVFESEPIATVSFKTLTYIHLLRERMAELELRLVSLEQEKKGYRVSDETAFEMLKQFIKKLKGERKKRIDSVDILLEFNFPHEQLERMMKRLEKERIIEEE